MWKYLNDDDIKEFLLSLHLIDEENEKKYFQKLYVISNNIKKNYKVYKINKRNGKKRIIYEPSPTLKYIQRQILNNILNNKSISKYAKAYHKGISLKDNALPHVDKKIILKLDIENFFPNISFWNIYKSCFPIEYFPKKVGMLLTYLCTIDDYLPQGAPTSSYISNLVMKEFDEELGYFCESKNISYTRYSDDLTFSGNFNPSEVINEIKKLLRRLDLTLNKEKIHIISNNKSQKVTGILVNKKVQVDKKYRNKIRQEVYYINKYGLESHLEKINYQLDKDKYLANLYGRILFCLQIDPSNKEFINYKKMVQLKIDRLKNL